MASDLAAHLLELETRLLNSPARADAAWLAEVLADDFVEVGSSGRTYDKAGVIAALTAPQATLDPSAHIDSVTVRLLAPCVALVTYQATGNERPRSLRSSVWRLEGDRWRLAFHQGTTAAA